MDTFDDVEIYSNARIDEMLYERSVMKDGQVCLYIHRSTGTSSPPSLYVALEDYRRLKEAYEALKE